MNTIFSKHYPVFIGLTIIVLGALYIFRYQVGIVEEQDIVSSKNQQEKASPETPPAATYTEKQHNGGISSDEVIRLTKEQQSARDEQLAMVRNELTTLKDELTSLREYVLASESQLKTERAENTILLKEMIEDPQLQTKLDNFIKQKRLLNQAEIEAVFAAEPIDFNWSSRVRSRIENDFMQTELGNGQLVSTECTTTLCKIVVDYPTTSLSGDALGPLEQAIFENELLASMGNELPNVSMSVVISDIDGSSRYELIAAKFGHTLPESPAAIPLSSMTPRQLKDLFDQY